MGKLLQVRDVPEEVHRTLKARAARSGRSLSEYIRAELTVIAERPSPEEVQARLSSRAPVEVDERPAEVIRRLRDSGA